MSLEIDKTIELLEEFITEADRLVLLPRDEGLNDKDLLFRKIKNLTLRVDKEKIQDYNDVIKPLVGILPQTDEGWQIVYIGRLRRMMNFLIAFKEDLELKRDFTSKLAKLDKLEAQIKEEEAEAKRRETVAEAKAWGSIIEVIDMLRDELKTRQDMQSDITQIKEDLRELKEILKKETEGEANG